MKNNILNIAKKTILSEAKTLENLANVLGEGFEKIIMLLAECKGRIIITGMGKSAIIAQKIVATLNSTGSPSIYMHAGDAIHGDLGMVTKDDILICLSKSGQTAELKLIIPLIKSLGSKIIGICSEPLCFLMENCDASILIPLVGEADSDNIIPTSSTTAQIAIGDAIAICLLSLRGFSKKDFALFHPGGSIGKQLFLKVSDFYTKNEKPAVLTNNSIRETIIEMTSKRLGATAVIDHENYIQGIITDGDLRRMLQSQKETKNLRASDVMTENPICISSEALAYAAFQKMKEKSISQIIVSSDEKYVGMLHLHDFIKEGFI